MKKKNPAILILRYFVYTLIIIITTYPLLFVIQTAFKTPIEFTRNFWLPGIHGLTLDNFYEVWFNYQFNIFFKNSFIVSVITTALVMLLSIASGYAFAKLKFPFSEKIFLLILSVLFLPVFIYVIPLFIQMRNFGLTNTLTSLVLVYTFFNLPSSVYICRNYYYSIPSELKESGLVDGATQLRVFTDIMLPLAKPAISCIAILTFINCWGEYIWTIVSNTDDNVKTIPAALSYFTTMSNVFWWYQMAALFIVIIPVVICYVAFNKFFIQGFTEGAVKG